MIIDDLIAFRKGIKTVTDISANIRNKLYRHRIINKYALMLAAYNIITTLRHRLSLGQERLRIRTWFRKSGNGSYAEVPVAFITAADFVPLAFEIASAFRGTARTFTLIRETSKEGDLWALPFLKSSTKFKMQRRHHGESSVLRV